MIKGIKSIHPSFQNWQNISVFFNCIVHFHLYQSFRYVYLERLWVWVLYGVPISLGRIQLNGERELINDRIREFAGQTGPQVKTGIYSIIAHIMALGTWYYQTQKTLRTYEINRVFINMLMVKIIFSTPIQQKKKNIK